MNDRTPDPVRQARSTAVDWLDSTLPPGWDDIDSAFDIAEWRKLFLSSPISTPGWPEDFGGLGLGPDAGTAVDDEVARRGAPIPLTLIGMRMIGETLLRWGTPAQQQRWLPGLATREEPWCQLFSEPGAGSDLASLATRAVRAGTTWTLNGQKVWCTFAADASWGMALARTEPNVPKHQGITAFAIDMRAEGVSVRPLVQITGDAAFSEVFLTDVRVPDSDRVGEVGDGWAVAVSLLSAERGLLGGRGASPIGRVGGSSAAELVERCRGTTDPHLRDRLVQALITERLVARLGERMSADPNASSLVKLAQTTSNLALQDLAVDMSGLTVLGYPTTDSATDAVLYGYLRSKANTIAGGTSEIVRTVIGERMLGLPKEPDPYRGVAWAETPRS